MTHDDKQTRIRRTLETARLATGLTEVIDGLMEHLEEPLRSKFVEVREQIQTLSEGTTDPNVLASKLAAIEAENTTPPPAPILPVTAAGQKDAASTPKPKIGLC